MSEYIVCPYCHNPLSQSEYVKVVRCRDCVFFDDAGEFGQWCTQLDFGKKEIVNGFCAWGERRDA